MPADIVLERFVSDVKRCYGGELLSVVVYGSAVAGEFVEGVSNINTLVLLRIVTPETLRVGTPQLARWRRDGIVRPLFLDPEFLKVACDAFPIELLDIKERHRVLYGQDFLPSLDISAGAAAAQCEQELKAKWLRLRQLYLEHAESSRAVVGLMLRSLGSFLALFRALLRSRDIPPPFAPDAILDRMKDLGLTLEATASLVRLRRSKERLREAEVHAFFGQYLADIGTVVGFIERAKSRGGRP